MAKFITLNGRKFAASKSEAIETVFQMPTADGWYRRRGNSIKLYSMRGDEIGGINRHGVLYATSDVDGRKWYSYASPVGEYASYGQCCREVQTAMEVTQ